MAKIAKAITAFITTAASVLVATPVTGGEYSLTVVVTAVVLGVVAAAAVWAVPNKTTA